MIVRHSVNLPRCEEHFSNQLKKLTLNFDYAATSRLAQQSADTEVAAKHNQQEYQYIINHQIKKSTSVTIRSTKQIPKREIFNTEDINKISHKYVNINIGELTTAEYLPSFKSMIGGSDYHLLSKDNVTYDEQPKHHQFMRKNTKLIVKRVSAATNSLSGSPDIRHL